MKVLVCGSRNWTNQDAVFRRLWDLPPYSEIIHGGAPGADCMASRFAQMTCCTERVFRPDYKRHKPQWAPKARNLLMLDEKPDLVIAFQRNGSRGTQHTIDEARRRGIPVEVHTA